MEKTLSIGNKEEDDYTKEEYHQLIKEAGMIDINIFKKEAIKEDVRNFANKLTVLDFNVMI